MIRLVLAITMVALVGCTAVSSVPAHLQSVKPALKASGGAFNASYSGNFTLRSCPGGLFTFSGSGSGSFIRGSSEEGAMSSNQDSCGWNGQATLTNTLHQRNTITVNLSLGNFAFTSPCSPRFSNGVHFTVVSGTGRFANATGSGTVKFACNNTSGKYTDQWSGTITF